MEDKTIITIAGMFILCVLELGALSHGINGQLFLAVLVIIAGAIGVPLGYIGKEKAGL